MMARRIESAGDIRRRARVARARAQARSRSRGDSAEIAGYFFRQNRPADAVTAAEQALKSTRTTSKRTTFSAPCYSAWADGGAPPPSGQTQASTRDSAIEHLTAIQNTPLMATNPNLQMTLGRLQLRAGKADLAMPILEKVAAAGAVVAAAAAAPLRSANLAGQVR